MKYTDINIFLLRNIKVFLFFLFVLLQIIIQLIISHYKLLHDILAIDFPCYNVTSSISS